MKTHVAGHAMRLGKLAIQRCMACGHALVETDLSCIAVPQGMSAEPSFFQVGAFVEVEESQGCTRSSIAGELPEEFEVGTLPETFCVALDQMQ